MAGIASGVNNAVARAAQLLAVAALPVAVGLSGDDYADPAAFTSGFRMAMIVCAALFAVGGVMSWLDHPQRRPAAMLDSRRVGRHVAYVDRTGRHRPVAATAVLLVGRIHVDLLRVCASRCPGR